MYKLLDIAPNVEYSNAIQVTARKNLEIVERHRHRYEVNPKFKDKMISAGLDVVGESIDGNLVEMIEIPKIVFT